MSLIPQLTDAGRSMITGAMDGGSIKFERMIIGAGETIEEPSKGDYWYDTGNEALNIYQDKWIDSGETFTASASAPAEAAEDDLWYDTENQQLKIYALAWHTENTPVTIADTAPESPEDGDFWYDRTNSLLMIYDATEDDWIEDTTHHFVYSASAPSSPQIGDWWYDVTHETLKAYTYAWDRSNTVFTYAGTAPTSGNLEGDLWYDTTNEKLQEYTAGWSLAEGVNFTFSTVAPIPSTTGDLWYDATEEQLKERRNGTWINNSTPITLSPSEPTSIASLTELIDPRITISLSAIVRGQNYVSISGTFTNADLQNGFRWSETGIIASDENGDEFLYAYCNSGDQYDYIPAGTDGRTIKADLTLLIAIGDAEDVSARIGDGAVYVTRAAFEEHLRASNPHGLTKEDVGLGNVENLSAEDLKPVFSNTASTIDFSNGDKLGVILGKLKNLVSLFNIHRNASNPHAGAASKDHKHSAADITSGSVALERGGTGADNATDARKNLGVNSIYRVERVTSEAIDFAANEYVSGYLSIPVIDGYTAVAIGSWSMLNSGSTSRDRYIVPNNMELYWNHITYHLVNTYNAANQCVLTATVLYIKNL